jgi:hypothetical protein
MRIVKSFLQFVWDFLIGDTPELFVGACLVILLGWITHLVVPSAAIVTLPVSVAVVLAWSLNRSRRR